MVLELDEDDERLLLELRERPLAPRKAVLLLGYDPSESLPALPDKSQDTILPGEATVRLRKFSDADLIEYDESTGKIHASPTLEESRVSPAGTRFVDVCSVISTAVLVLLAAVYLVIPIDFFPEAVLGPVGYIDDILLSGLAALPLGKRMVRFLPGRRRKKEEQSGSQDAFSD